MRLYHFPPPIWPLPSRSGRSEAAAHIRDTYVDQAWRQAGPLRRASFAAACLLWPIAAAAMAARETWRSGSTLARRLGKGRCLQFLEQYQLALRHGILPRYYYVFELHDPALRAVALGAVVAPGLSTDLDTVLHFSKSAVRIVKLSFLLSSFYNVIGLSIAAAGLLSPVVCAILMPVSSITVVAFACGATVWAGRKLEAA